MAIEFDIVTDEHALMSAIKECQETGICSFDYETAPTKYYRRQFSKDETKLKPKLKKPATDTSYAEICTISFAPHENKVFVVPISHKVGVNYQGSNALDLIDKHLFRNEDVTKVAYNLPFESKFTTAFGGMLMGTCVDPMHLLIRLAQVEGTAKYPLFNGMGLKAQTLEKLGHKMEEFSDVVYGVDHFDETDIFTSFSYSGEDSIYSLRLMNLAKDKLEKIEINQKVNGIDFGKRPYSNYYDFLVGVECAVLRVIGMMEHNGIGFGEGYSESLERAKKLKAEALVEIISIGAKYQVEIKPGSNGKTKSVKEFLFNTLKCPVYFKTEKGAPSLDTPSLKLLVKTIRCNLDDPAKLDDDRFIDVALRQLEDKSVIQHANREDLLALLDAIMKVQSISTLISSHMEGRLKYASLEDGRVRSGYDLFPETGRFASSSPNMQNVSKDGKSPISVRGLHKPEVDSIFVAIDFSAQEVRVGADLYQDKDMKRNILEGIDMHSYSANTIFNLGFTMEELEAGSRAPKEYRNPAKIGLFQVFYGGSAYSIKNILNAMDMYPNVDECHRIVDGLKTAFKGIPWFQKHIGDFLWEHGYVETFLGYRRYLPGLRSPETVEQKRALRQAYNSPIQGSAGDITKVAMNNVYDALGRGEVDPDKVKLIATIHDELLFEVKKMSPTALESTVAKLVECMEVKVLDGLAIGQVAEPEVADHHNLYGVGANHWGMKRDFHEWLEEVNMKEAV